jgi:hypothetical protein
LFWSHDRPPYFQAGYADGHAESIPVPVPVYRLVLKKVNSISKSDRPTMAMFKAADTKEWKTFETWLKSQP